MTIDMSQFYQVFFEETGEHLASMESLLLALDVDAPDPEQLNAIFRAAHSIKGSSGTFGFNDMAEVTHILENLLDHVRKGELGLRNDMIDAFLEAGDVLKGMLAVHKGEGEADPAAARAICDRLHRLTAAGPVSSVQAGAGPAEASSGWEIQFVLEGDAAHAEKTVEIMLADLGGPDVARIVARPEAENQPWKLEVHGEIDPERVRDGLEFVARTDSIRIDPVGGAGDSSDGAYGFFTDEAFPEAAADDEAFGFFEPLPAVDASDGAYGFFAELPVAPPPEPAPPVAVQTPEKRKAAPVAAASAKAGSDATIRVGVDKVDQLINLIGELVITQAMLTQSASGIDPVEFERLHNGMVQLERNTRDLQEAVMSIRMMPISVVFSRFPRVVRDIAQKLGKQIELKMIGESTELDKSLIERITDPLTHLVRNSLDHGIEMPEERAAKGKQPVGTITLKAYHQSGNIVIEVGDDGAGLNRQKILSKARERGLAVSDQMTDGEVWQLIFEAGFSTADQITEVSGRGVGMDVVKKNIAAMGGRVDIESMTGIGTRMTVRLPLTLAILDGMSVAVGGDTFIIPLGYVIESLQPARNMVKSISGVERLLQVRGEYLPVIPLHEVFGIPGATTSFEQGIMVVLEADGMKAALFVDALVGQHQVVIKSLESNYRKVAGVSGATIMGDGHVALILDAIALAGMAKNALPAAA